MKKNIRGFTLIELLTVVAIIGIVVAVIAGFFYNPGRDCYNEMLRSCRQDGQKEYVCRHMAAETCEDENDLFYDFD